ncbi:MAG: lamin tail domain-containing protein, partial [Firmicutes bacterium]|nr:lamin tail domain-containing protein [Bacillota bacterium]
MTALAQQKKIKKKIQAKHLLMLLACLLLLIFLLCRNVFGSHTLFINEVMSSNRCVITDEDGDYSDWFELYNSGTTTLDLTGYWLSDDPTNPLKWEMPSVTIMPDEYLLIFASGKDRNEPQGPYLHTNFSLKAEGETLVLSTPDVRPIDRVEIGPLFSNISRGRSTQQRDRWVYFFDATPGAANNANEYKEIKQLPATDISVTINEYITANKTSLIDTDGDLVDWIEFYNAGDSVQNLTGFWLSDKVDNPFKWRFPEVVLQPKEYLVVYASGKNRSSNGNLHTNFQLNDTQDQLVFSTADGHLIEELAITKMIPNVSYGRDHENPEQWLYFPAPTPGMPNDTQGFVELSGKSLPTTYNLHINEAQTMNRG